MKSPYFPQTEKSANDLYYEAMDLLGGSISDAKKAERLLITALALDNNNVQTHIGFSHVYGILKDTKKAHAHIVRAYKETVKKFPTWPRKLEWADMDNRAYLRAIQYRADLHADVGEKDEATKLYTPLLKLNPNDNQGVRYTLSGVYAGITGKEINNMFAEGNKKQDWSKLENLVKRENTKHKFWKEPRSQDI
jgi:tetratricopeptide (TPR) repeat protein